MMRNDDEIPMPENVRKVVHHISRKDGGTDYYVVERCYRANSRKWGKDESTPSDECEMCGEHMEDGFPMMVLYEVMGPEDRRVKEHGLVLQLGVGCLTGMLMSTIKIKIEEELAAAGQDTEKAVARHANN